MTSLDEAAVTEWLLFLGHSISDNNDSADSEAVDVVRLDGWHLCLERTE